MDEKTAGLKKLNGVSLSFKILLPLLFSTAVIILAYSSYLIKDQRIQKEALLEKKAQNYTYTLAQSNIEALWSYSFDQLDGLSRAFLKDPDIIQIIITDHRDNVQVRLEKNIKGSREIKKRRKILKDNEHIGNVETAFTNFYIEKELTQTKNRIILLAMILFTILALLIFLISRSIILKPLARVLDGMNHISRGNYNYNIDIISNDEIGQLAGRFNDMSGQINKFQEWAVASAESKKEMQIAKNIQMSLQPSLEKFKDFGFQISANMTPAEDVGGDYYDLIQSCDNKLWLAIGDVTGHGLLSSLVMMMAQVSINTQIRSFAGLTPEEVLINANTTIQSNIRDSLKQDHHMTLTLIKEEEPGSYLYAGAHEIILIYRAASRTIEQIQTRGMWIGMIPDISKPTKKHSGTFTLEKDDILFLYTDGVIEIKNQDSEQYDIQRLSDFLIAHADQEPEAIEHHLLSELNRFKHRQTDDITFIVMKKE